MIITLQLKLDLSNKIHKQLDELKSKQLNKKQYNKEKKQILAYMKQELKKINKEHPLDKEIQKLLDEDNNE